MKSLSILLIAFATVPAIPKAPPEPTDRERVLAVASTQVGIIEATGRNDGPVEKYIASVGLNPKAGYPYCAAFIYWVGKEALGSENPYPKSAWSPDFLKGGTRVTSSTEIKGGEALGIWFRNKGRIAHVCLGERRDGPNIITNEANTNANAAVGSESDRDGQGVYRKRRHWRTVHSLRDWISK